MADIGSALQQGSNFFSDLQDSRRKTAAYNALRASYGDIAGDPDLANALQANSQREQMFPGQLERQGIDNAGAVQEQQQSAEAFPVQQQGRELNNSGEADKQRRLAALNGARFVLQAASRGADPVEAFDFVAPRLGMQQEEAAQWREKIRTNPEVLQSIVDALSADDGSSRWQIVQGEDGTVRRVGGTGPAEDVLGADGLPVKGYQAPQAAQRNTLAAGRLQQQIDTSSPEYIADKAAATAAGTVEGNTAASMPSLKAVLTTARARIEEVRRDPNIDAVFGSPTFRGMLQKGGFGSFYAIPGTPAADAANRIKALMSELRTQAYESLRGGGHITEAESQFAADSLANLDRAQSKQSFLAELTNLEDVLNRGEKAAESRASGAARPTPRSNVGGRQSQPQFQEGKVYQDANGKTARYQNGKWVPVQ